ncbi:reverse transcriptase [Trifolium pratense]|uniref:Reverse transcriptase n=1 Tax=Trifolium pratense TaxID=57577 RepID=A0A2K3NAA8_TRIPR|nr:reverse transcriptase [Trifolium pratense]
MNFKKMLCSSGLVTSAEARQSVQQDVKSAFVNGKLEKEVYVEQPQGFKVKSAEDKVPKQQEEFELMVKPLKSERFKDLKKILKVTRTNLINGRLNTLEGEAIALKEAICEVMQRGLSHVILKAILRLLLMPLLLDNLEHLNLVL